MTAEEEQVIVRVEQRENCVAPVRKGEEAGMVSYYLKEKSGEEILLKELPLYITEDVEELDFEYILRYVLEKYCLV